MRNKSPIAAQNESRSWIPASSVVLMMFYRRLKSERGQSKSVLSRATSFRVICTHSFFILSKPLQVRSNVLVIEYFTTR